MKPVVEVALFRLKPGVSDAEFMPGVQAVQDVIEKLDGYISRELVRAPDGQWVDIVHWTSLEAARSAEPVVMADEGCMAFFALIDESAGQMIYADSVRVYPEPQPA